MGLVGAEQQVLYGVVVGGGAFDGLVATGRAGFEAGLFGGLDGAEQGDLAVIVEIHANAEVDLGAAGVSVEGFVQTKDRVAGEPFPPQQRSKSSWGLQMDGEEERGTRVLRWAIIRGCPKPGGRRRLTGNEHLIMADQSDSATGV